MRVMCCDVWWWQLELMWVAEWICCLCWYTETNAEGNVGITRDKILIIHKLYSRLPYENRLICIHQWHWAVVSTFIFCNISLSSWWSALIHTRTLHAVRLRETLPALTLMLCVCSRVTFRGGVHQFLKLFYSFQLNKIFLFFQFTQKYILYLYGWECNIMISRKAFKPSHTRIHCRVDRNMYKYGEASSIIFGERNFLLKILI